ncbi:hypothetical protein [Microbispora sp. H10836]|uniref:hypothetical protein n=1 Tax=Microbispora sp. H10836 TaxID=2729106 RepID=UPI0014739478|nr:hypothetical protein [Microbispora sp. H10836]
MIVLWMAEAMFARMRKPVSIALTAALVTTSSCSRDGGEIGRKEWAELYSAYGVALAVAHPDYGAGLLVDFSREDNTLPTGAPGTVPIELVPLPAHLATPPRTVALDPTMGGNIDLVTIPDTAATEVLRKGYLKGTGRPLRQRRKVERFLAGLAGAVSTAHLGELNIGVALVIELKEPLTYAELAANGLEGDRVLFPALGPAHLPLSWSEDNCRPLHTAACEATDVVAQFRAWLRDLSPVQRRALTRKAFDLTAMRSTAGDGLVCGVMVDWTPPADALKMVRDPHVRAAYLVGVVQTQIVP